MAEQVLVGDVGGTNARLALCSLQDGSLSHIKNYSGAEYPSLEAVIRVYLEETAAKVSSACIAIACQIGRAHV